MLDKKLKNRIKVQNWRKRNPDLVKLRARNAYYRERLIVLKLLAERDTEGRICCVECGSIKNLDIHHKEKLNDNYKARHYRWGYLEELDIRCRSCHRRLHSAESRKVKKVEKKEVKLSEINPSRRK